MEFLSQLGRGALGVGVLLLLAFAMSSSRGQVKWRPVAVGVGLQLLLAFLVLRVGWVRLLFEGVSRFFVELLGFSMKGAEFIFGDLIDKTTYGFIFAFQVLPSIIFFSALTSVLFYLGILQRVVFGFAWVMSRLMRLSGAESLAAAANVFIGQTEAPLVIKPYIDKMTRSEIMALMCGGMATIAGAVMALYISMLGGDSDVERQKFATFLLCASVMNAPAALVVAKLIVPETEEVSAEILIPRDRVGSNILDALANGTTQGLKLALNVAAMLLVFIAMIALVNFVLGNWVGLIPWGSGSLNDAVAAATGGKFEVLSLQAVCGFLFAPVAFLIGVGGSDLLHMGQLLGEKMIINELVAYSSLANLNEAGALSNRSVFIATFALCGFANFSSIGIQLGGIGALAPAQRPALAALGFRAMLGGTIACLLTATVAGIFYSAP